MISSLGARQTPNFPGQSSLFSNTCAGSEDDKNAAKIFAPPECYAIMLYSYDWTVSELAFMKQSEDLSANARFLMEDIPNEGLDVSLCIDKYSKLRIKLQNSFYSDYNPKLEKGIHIQFLNLKQEAIDNLTFSIRDPLNYVWQENIDVAPFLSENSLTMRFSVSLRCYDHAPRCDIDNLNEFCQDMQSLFDNRKDSADIKIVVGTQKFLAHKSILSCQSSYFAEIFEQNYLLKSVDPEIVELDGEGDLFLCVLTYVYTGKIFFRNIKSDFDLYECVKKYKFSALASIFQLRQTVMHSKVDFELLTYEWNIPRALIDITKFCSVASPSFKSPFDSSIEWELVARTGMFAQMIAGLDCNCVCLSLRCRSSKSVATIFQMSLFKPDTSDSEDREFANIFYHKTPEYPSHLDIFSYFNNIASSVTSDYFLRVRCAIRISKGAIRSESESSYYSSGSGEVHFKLWSSNFGKLLKDSTFSDVCIEVGNKVFNADKLILSARSSVFRKMFEVNMSESVSGVIKIKDVDALTMDFLLKYIYTGEIPYLGMEFVSDIFQAANKYDLLFLRNKCSKFMKKNITFENACELLVLGDLYEDPEMKYLAKDYICRNSGCLASSTGQVLMKADPDRFREIFDTLSSAYSNHAP